MPNDLEPIALKMHNPVVVTMPKKTGTRRRIVMPDNYPDVRLRIVSTSSVFLELADVPDGSPLEGEAYETIASAGVPVFRHIRRGEVAISSDKSNARVELTAEPHTGGG